MPTAAEIEKSHRARALLEDDVFAECLYNVKMTALMKLADIDASDTNGILKLQAMAAFADEFRDQIEAIVLASGELNGGYQQNSPRGE